MHGSYRESSTSIHMMGAGVSNISPSWIHKARKGLSGWQATTATGMCLSILVFGVNLGLTIWGLIKGRGASGMFVLQSGNCADSQRLGLWIHLLINVLSTLLLGASNYAMQVLCAPTRKEVDKAHSEGTWMNIGVWSFHNLRRIDSGRVFICFFLMLSSLPLHLVYNSVFFSTIVTREIRWGIVSPEFVSGSSQSPPQSADNLVLEFYALQPKVSSWERLEPAACFEAYSKRIVTDRGSVVAVTYTHSILNPITDAGSKSVTDPNGLNLNWLCDSPCSILAAAPTSFTKVNYCLSQQVPESCEFSFNLPLMITVIVCNAIKIICLALVLWWNKSNLIMTIGDAVASFLDTEDETTQDMCLVSRKGIKAGWPSGSGTYKIYKHKNLRLFHAVSIRRWLTCYLLCAVVIGVAIALLSIGLKALPGQSFSYIWSLGFGTLTAESIVYLSWLLSSLNGAVLLANAPQLLLSILYLLYNGIFTGMLGMHEYARFAHHRKGLRVSSTPRGAQRNSYYLQVPLKYGVPLLGVSAVLHWLVSQSIFLALVKTYADNGSLLPYGGYQTCGYSCIAIVFTLALGGVALAVGLGMGCRRLPSEMPLATGCSVVISAACHPRNAVSRTNGAESAQESQWGEVRASSFSDGDVGHCNFSARSVELPVEGKIYGSTRI